MKKLFVVGLDEPNPNKWGPWAGSHCVVVASDEHEARQLVDDLMSTRTVTEVDMTQSAILFHDDSLARMAW